MSINKKSNHLRIRISNSQYERLQHALINENKTKSTFIRELLDRHFNKKPHFKQNSSS